MNDQKTYDRRGEQGEQLAKKHAESLLLILRYCQPTLFNPISLQLCTLRGRQPTHASIGGGHSDLSVKVTGFLSEELVTEFVDKGNKETINPCKRYPVIFPSTLSTKNGLQF